MAKFFKSFFGPSEKKKNYRCDGDEEDKNDFTPPLDDRRKLSISRSGRMRQANKKRHSLSLDVYGEVNHIVEKPKSMEYHVNNPMKITSGGNQQRRHSGDPKTQTTEQKNRKKSTEREITPEEEIDSAFEILDKAL